MQTNASPADFFSLQTTHGWQAQKLAEEQRGKKRKNISQTNQLVYKICCVMQLIKKVTEIIRCKGVLKKLAIFFREKSRKKRDAHNNAERDMPGGKK